MQGWIAAPDAERPPSLEILSGTIYREVLNELVGIYSSAPQERSGVFSTVQVMTASLSNLQIAQWVNPALGEESARGRKHFDPLRFLEGANTLYSLSKDGSGSAKALVTALTVAVCDAAEQKPPAWPGAVWLFRWWLFWMRQRMCAGGRSFPSSTRTTVPAGS